MRYSELLFNKYDIHHVIESQKQNIRKEVERLAEQRILNSSVEDLVAYFVEKYQINVPILDLENAVSDQRESDVEVSGFMYGLESGETRLVPGTLVTLEIPFSGDKDMFHVQPSTFTLNPPRADVKNGLLVLNINGTKLSGDKVQEELNAKIGSIQDYLNNQSKSTEPFNGQIDQITRTVIEQRRKKLLENQNLLAGLSFKMKARSDAPKTYSAGPSRRKIEPRLPPASTSAFRPEPVLPEVEYAQILKIIQDMTQVMERSPSSFVNMVEEDIRQHYLVQLNGQYEGKATGETFNAAGKTDILIRDNGKNIFIAECKFWRGDKSYVDAIDQVLSYLSWRDTKAAIIVFNKNKDFSSILEKVKTLTSEHQQCKSGPKEQNETQFRYVFGQTGDASREVVLTVLCFDIPRVIEKTKTQPKIGFTE